MEIDYKTCLDCKKSGVCAILINVGNAVKDYNFAKIPVTRMLAFNCKYYDKYEENTDGS